MTTRIAFGIPHRVGACACQIGKGREEQGVIEATEIITDFDNVVANKPLDPGHSITAVAYTDKVEEDGRNDGVTSLATHIRCWPSYPEQTGLDPKLIIKTKGDVAAGVGGSFPSITITLRPLKTVLNYSYAGNLNNSGQGEIGYESLNQADDTIYVNRWLGGRVFPDYFTDPEGADEDYFLNQQDFTAYILEAAGQMVTINETHYFKSEDRPGDEPTPWQPLSGLELDPTFHPRLPSMDSYAFGRNESYDCRHLFPANYLSKYGLLTMDEGYLVTLPEVSFDGAVQFPEIPQGDWQWKTYAQYDPGFLPPRNPIFQPTNNDIFIGDDSIDEGIAPVIKGWYWDSSTPPTNGLYGLFQSTSFKMLKEVRKRYPFSFRAEQTRVEDYRVVDHTPGNQRIISNVDPNIGSYLTREPAFYNATHSNDNAFQGIAWWRMEVNAELCGWNSKKVLGIDPISGQPKTTVQGIKIKGVIKLAMKRLQPGNSPQGLYSNMFTPYFGSFWDRFTGISPSFVFRCVATPYFDEDFIQRYTVDEYDAGEIPWEVTLDEDNAKGQPEQFLDFPITAAVEFPDQPSPDPGSLNINSLVFIKDFIVTEVILP